jgi:vacuolar-type H+-ATPase subunit H
MCPETNDAIEALKNAEEAAASAVASAKSEAEMMVKRAHEEASAILDNVAREAALQKQRISDSRETVTKAECDAILTKAREEAQRMTSQPIDKRLVESSMKEFMGGLGV